MQGHLLLPLFTERLQNNTIQAMLTGILSNIKAGQRSWHRIPVIGNGGIYKVKNGVRMMERQDTDFVSYARGAMGILDI